MNVMKFCPECYKELPPNASICPFCGHDTGNGDSEPAFKPPKQKKTGLPSSIPIEQTILSLLIIGLCFWGVSIAIVLLPVFINPGNEDQMLVVGIVSQVLLRIPIGYFALEEQSFYKDLSFEKKFGNFLLVFIPLGAIIPFLSAAKGAVRNNRLSEFSVGAVGAIALFAVLLYGTQDTLLGVEEPGDPASASAAVSNPASLEGTLDSSLAEDSGDEESQESVDSAAQFNPEIDPTCTDPSMITLDDEGRSLTVCGRVTNYGDLECESCPGGYISFIRINETFKVVSYDWQFTFAWLGDCLKVADDVEILGDEPVFVFGKGEGYAGTECSIDLTDELVCEGGVYFQDYFGCSE